MTLQHVAVELAHRQRQMPVRAAIFERHWLAGLGAVEHNRLAQNCPAKRLAPDLVLARGDIPVVAQEHERFSTDSSDRQRQARCPARLALSGIITKWQPSARQCHRSYARARRLQWVRPLLTASSAYPRSSAVRRRPRSLPAPAPCWRALSSTAERHPASFAP